MIFRTIGTGDDTQVVGLLKARKIAQDELNASLAEQASVLETDALELRKLETAVANGATYEEAFASSIKNASTAAKEHAIQTKGASGSTDVFVSKQRSAQASLRATATASKTASVAMRALSMAMNMIAIGLFVKGLELLGSAISNYIHRVEKANEKIEESRSSYEDAKSSIESMNDELKTTQDKIETLQSKGVLSFTDKEELDNLKEQNDELERSISLEEKKKQNAASQTVNDIKQNKDTLSDDFEESIKNLSEYKKEYEDTKQIGIKRMSDGTVTLENFEVTMTAMDKTMDLYENHVLENIEKFEQYKEDIINKYGTDDVSQFSQSDRDLYNSIVSQLQEAYKTIYSDSDYNKFVIEPIFDQDNLKGLQDQLLQYFVNGGSTDTSALEEKFGTDIIDALRNACEKAGIDFDKMIEDMYNNSQSKLNQIAPIIEAPNGAEDAKQNQVSKEIRDYIQNDLSEEDRTILLNAEIPDDVKFKTTQDVDNFIASLNKEANETPISSFKDAWSGLEKGKDELTKLAEAGRLTVDALKGLDGGKTLMEQTGLSAEKLAESINNLTDASTQLNSLSGQISKMSDMLADKKNGKATDAKDLAGFDAEVRGLDSWKEFEKVMGSSKSTMAECQKAANALATEWVNSGNYLENLTEENKNYYITQLQSMGVENAEAVITASLAQKKYNLALEQDYLNLMKANGIAATNDLANVTATEIQRLLDEGKITSDTASKMAELVIKKRMANGNTISTAADIKNLADLAGASTKLGKLLNNLARIKQGFTNGMPSDIAEKQAEMYQKQIEALVGGGNSVNVDTGINIKDAGSSNNKQTGGSGSGSSTKIDWIERRLTTLQNKIDITQSKFENLFSVKSKSNNLQKQISLINKLLNATNKSADRYKKAANSVKLSSSLKKKVREGSYNITEYDSKTANAINEYKDLYDKYKDLEKQATELTKTILEKKIEKNQLYIDRADANREKSESIIANKRVDNATSLNKSLEYQKEQIKTSYNYQIKNAKLENDSVKVQKLKADKQRELTELTKQEFDNVQNAYEYRQKSNLAQKEALSDALSLAEARGDVIGKAYYDGQQKATKADLKSKQDELTALEKSLKNIKQGTSEWYDAMDAIYAVRSAIRQDEIELVNLQNKLDQVNFDRFDEFINKIEDVSNELNFLKGVLSDELFDDKGGITADGMTAIGLTLMNGDVAASKRDYYKQQLEQLEKDYSNGTGTIGYNTYIEKQREYNQAIQDSTTAMVDAKKAAVNYVKQGLDAQNDALQKAVDKQKELIEEQQELQKWNDKIADQNKSINRMQRRLDILSQDDSQENQKTIRELRDKLETARKEQKNDFYDKSVDDQKNSLDQMVKDAKEKSENYLKDSEKVFADATAYINANSTQVASNLKHISKELGYDISTYITDAWKDGGNAITGYSNTLTRNIGGITAQIGLIKSAWDEVCKSADKAAKAIVNANSADTAAKAIVNVNPADIAAKAIVNAISANNDNSSNSGSNNTVTNKEIKNFINDSLNRPTHGESYYGTLNEYLYRKTGKVLSKKEEVQLAKMLGVSVKDDLSGSGDRQKILNALLKRKIAFANGGVLGDLVRLTGEDGLFIGSRGESVLTQEQTKALINFAPVIPQLSSMLNTIKNLPVNSNMVQYPVYNIDNKTIVEGVATNEIVKNMESVAKQQAETVIKKINNSAYSKGVRR